MSELLKNWLADAEWRKGYDEGRKDARREPTFGQRRNYMLASDRYRERKGAAFCAGYEAGYREVLWAA